MMRHGNVDNAVLLARDPDYPRLSGSTVSYSIFLVFPNQEYSSGLTPWWRDVSGSWVRAVYADVYRPFTAPESVYAESLLHAIASVADINFQFLASGGTIGFGASKEQLFVQKRDDDGNRVFDSTGNPVIIADLKGWVISQKSDFGQSDVWIDPDGDLATIGHEIGHALGLRHTHDDELGEEKPYATLSLAENTKQFSIMSYINHPDPETGVVVEGGSRSRRPDTLQLYDIAALQWHYGPRASNEQDTVYRSWINQDGGDKAFAIWDSGGVDRIEAGDSGPGVRACSEV